MTRRLDSDVAIIGGGIVGASAALFLRKIGKSVTLLERDFCGSMEVCDGRAAPSYNCPWPSVPMSSGVSCLNCWAWRVSTNAAVI